MVLGAKLLVGNSILKLMCFAIVLILKEKAVKKIVKSTGKAGVQIFDSGWTLFWYCSGWSSLQGV